MSTSNLSSSTSESSVDLQASSEHSLSEQSPELPSIQKSSTRAVWVALGVVALIASVLLFNGLARLGIWDPYELSLADLGCRQAAHSGAFDVSTCGSEPSVKNDARSSFMVHSVALGFRIFGLSEWAGRVPLACWILIGALIVTLAIQRLVDARAGMFAGLAFVTMPMVLTQGRLMFGDAVTMGAFAISLSAWSVCVFLRGEGRTLERIVWVVIGLAGVYAGIGSRGLAVGCAPVFAIGLTWLLRSAHTNESDEKLNLWIAFAIVIAGSLLAYFKLAPVEISQSKMHMQTLLFLVGFAIASAIAVGIATKDKARRMQYALSGFALAMGAVGVVTGVLVLFMSEQGHFVAAVGATLNTSRKFPTFDLLIRQIAHGTFPWGCLLPFALGRMFAQPAASGTQEIQEVDVRVSAFIAATFAFAAQTLMAPHFGLTPFAAPVAFAILIALVLRDLERMPAGSLAFAIGTAVLVGLVLNDFNFGDLAKSPVELATAPIIEPYGLYGVMVPKELQDTLKNTFTIAACLFLIPVFFVWSDDNPRPGWTRFKQLLEPIKTVRAALKDPQYNGWIALILAAEVGLMIVGLLTMKAAWRQKIPMLQQLDLVQRFRVVNAWWAIPVALCAAWIGFPYVRDAFRSLRTQRVVTVVIGGLIAASLWSFRIMPVIANHYSPKGVFSTYRRVAQNNPIGLLGVNARTAVYDLGNSKPVVFNDSQSAYRWLTQNESDPKFLALRLDHLPEMNRLYREKASPKHNLPILDGKTGQILLASNSLREANQNPLNSLVLDDVPSANSNCNGLDQQLCAPSHTLDCNIDNKLQCVGWDLLSPNGSVLKTVTSTQRVKLRLLFRVTGAVSGNWQVFIHVEQPGSATARKTADHTPLNGKYPMNQWLTGDIIVDDYEFNLEPNMRSGLPITIMIGFFSGNSRMPLLSGPDAGPEAEGARLVVGSIPVQ